MTSYTDIPCLMCTIETMYGDCAWRDGPEGEITEDRIWRAWHELDPAGEGPDMGIWHAWNEHGQWWVVGYTSDDERHTYSVVEATGPGSVCGLAFEES